MSENTASEPWTGSPVHLVLASASTLAEPSEGLELSYPYIHTLNIALIFNTCSILPLSTLTENSLDNFT
jgi:hypothetical protein